LGIPRRLQDQSCQNRNDGDDDQKLNESEPKLAGWTGCGGSHVFLIAIGERRGKMKRMFTGDRRLHLRPKKLLWKGAVVMFDFADLRRHECTLQKNPTQKDFFQ
jgi:hypothetical protein